MTITELVPKKICNQCKEEKPLTEFHHDTHSSSGYRHNCKVCRNLEKSARGRRQREQEAAERERIEQERQEAAEKAVINKRAILRLINAHRSEFESYVNAETITSRDGNPESAKAWIRLA